MVERKFGLTLDTGWKVCKNGYMEATTTETGDAMTREEWLNALVEKLRPSYRDELPEVIKISVGFTSKGVRSNRIGECWHPEASADHVPQVFVHPKMSDGTEVAGVVVHELIHACRPEAAHGKDFRKVAVRIGLEGKMTSTTVGPELLARLAKIVDELGPYPHGALVGGLSSTGPKQGTRMLKVECPDCGYVVRTTAKWLDMGAPICGPCTDETGDIVRMEASV